MSSRRITLAEAEDIARAEWGKRVQFVRPWQPITLEIKRLLPHEPRRRDAVGAFEVWFYTPEESNPHFHLRYLTADGTILPRVSDISLLPFPAPPATLAPWSLGECAMRVSSGACVD